MRQSGRSLYTYPNVSRYAFLCASICVRDRIAMCNMYSILKHSTYCLIHPIVLPTWSRRCVSLITVLHLKFRNKAFNVSRWSIQRIAWSIQSCYWLGLNVASHLIDYPHSASVNPDISKIWNPFWIWICRTCSVCFHKPECCEGLPMPCTSQKLSAELRKRWWTASTSVSMK